MVLICLLLAKLVGMIKFRVIHVILVKLLYVGLFVGFI